MASENPSKAKYYLLILLLSLLPFLAMMASPLFPHTQDGLVHLARIAAHFKALASGQFPPRWASDLNYGYGMPIFIFAYPLPYFLTSFLMAIGANLQLAFKLVLVLSFMLSGIFMFEFISALFKNQRTAFLVAMFYQFLPFRIVEANVRGDIGEVYTYAFLPLLLLGILQQNFLLTSLATALLILSHNSVSLLFLGVSLAFAIFFAKNLKQLFLNGLGLIVGLSLSAFYWLPALYEDKFTLGNLFMKTMFKEYFTPLYKFFLPNFSNLPQLNMIDVSVQLGLFSVVILLLSFLILLETKNQKRKLLIFPWVIFLPALFFTQPISSFFWERIGWLRQFQFPWRFLTVMIFAITLLSGVVFSSFKIFKNNLFCTIFLILVIFSTVKYWQTPFGYDRLNEQDYWNYPLTTTHYGEFETIWIAHPANKYPQNKVEVIGGDGTIMNFVHQPLIHTFKLKSKTPVNVLDQTLYFPGWRVFANGREIPIQFQDPSNRGLITFSLAKGEYKVEVKFGRTKDRTIAELISLTSLGGVVLFFFKNHLDRRRKLS